MSNTPAHRIQITLSGELYTVLFRLDGQEIALAFDGQQTWTRTLQAFPIGPGFRLYLYLRGAAASTWTLKFQIDRQRPLRLRGILENGAAERLTQIPAI